MSGRSKRSKPQVEAQWRAEQIDKALAAKAADLVKQLRDGASFADVAKSVGAVAKPVADIRRDEKTSLPESVVAAIFREPADGAGSAATADGRIVFKIDRRQDAAGRGRSTRASSRWPRSSTRRAARVWSINIVTALRRTLGVQRQPRTFCNPLKAASSAMTVSPDYEVLSSAPIGGRAERSRSTTLVADLETPVSAYLKLARGRAGNMFLLESVEGGAQRGRYSMIGLDPDLVFRSTGERAEINRKALHEPDAFAPFPGKPLAALRALLDGLAHQPAAGAAADVGGRVRLSRLRHGAADGAARARQARPDRRARHAVDPADRDGRVRRRARRDGDRDAGPPGSRRVGAARRYESGRGAARRRRRRARSAARPRRRRNRRSAAARRRSGLQHHRSRISWRWSPRRRTTSPPATLSRSCCRSASPAASTCPPSRSTGRCRRVNPSPYLCYLDFGGFQIVVSSPEILVRVRDGKVVIRPIAGTRRAARRRARTQRWRRSCSPTPRSAPNT